MANKCFTTHSPKKDTIFAHEYKYMKQISVCVWGVHSQVPLSSSSTSPALLDIPTNLTDLELFKKYCMPLGQTDLWHEVTRHSIGQMGGMTSVLL